jgi:hypothetical protein
MDLKFDADGGDLGIPKNTVHTIDSFLSSIRVADEIFEGLKYIGIRENIRYAVTLSGIFDKEKIMKLQSDLIEFRNLYSVDGRKLFEVRGPSGGLANMHVVYVVLMGKD